MQKYLLPLCFVIGTTAACGSDGQNPGNPDGGVLDAPVDPEGPVFLAFDTNIDELTDGETVRFSAVLTDPDGIEDLIGGVLTSEDGEITYGSFATSGQEGSYSLELSWAEFHLAEPLDFANEQHRAFRAEFFDVAGHANSQTLTLRFFCDEDTDLACEGSCESSVSDDHCGSCGQGCDDTCGPNIKQCVTFESITTNRDRTCNEICSSVSLVCTSDWQSATPQGAQFIYVGLEPSFADCDAVAPPVIESEGSTHAWRKTICACLDN